MTKSKNKSERHHWWPEGVSRLWVDKEGGVTWLRPDGTERKARPDGFGVIGNGHFIKLGHEAGERTPWDQNFEPEFQQADDQFRWVIKWLNELNYDDRRHLSLRERFIPQPLTDEMFGQLLESIVSLAIRSPMTRESCVSVAESLRGPLPERERNSLIAMNMRDMHRRAVKDLGVRGKATAILSPDREFIFGDGFYHNFVSPSGSPNSPRILVPLTPSLAVLYAKPMQYTTEPRLSTLVIGGDETKALNEVVQVYAGGGLFYRSEKPEIIDAYSSGKHLEYRGPDHIVEKLIHHMPGVPDRDTSLDFLFRRT